MALPIDLSQVILHSGYDTYENVGVYRGSFSLATSIGPSMTTLATTTATLPVSPTYLKIYYYAYDWYQAVSGRGTTPRWWNSAMGGTFSFGTYSTTDSNYIQFGINASLSGNIVTIKAEIFNPYAHNSTIVGQTIQYVMIDYTTVQE